MKEYDDDESEQDLNRLNLSIDDWCPCKICIYMATERECVCCHDLDAAHIFDLKGALLSFLRSFLIDGLFTS